MLLKLYPITAVKGGGFSAFERVPFRMSVQNARFGTQYLAAEWGMILFINFFQYGGVICLETEVEQEEGRALAGAAVAEEKTAAEDSDQEDSVSVHTAEQKSLIQEEQSVLTLDARNAESPWYGKSC